MLGITLEKKKSADFLTSDYCARILRENKLTVHIDMGNFYFDDFNTHKSFYDFILAQQDMSEKNFKCQIKF